MKYTTDILSEIQTWCHYADTVEEIHYGALYNWYAATDVREITSAGWHMPTEADAITLQTYLGGGAVAGGKLKEIGTTYWTTPNTGADNSSGFNAIGAGLRIDGVYDDFNDWVEFWTSNHDPGDPDYSTAPAITYNNTSFYVWSQSEKKIAGISIRPLEDSTTLTHGRTGTYTGNDGKVYRTICIGTHEWLADSLAETKYRDGSAIPVVTDNAACAALVTGAMCYYNNDISNA